MRHTLKPSPELDWIVNERLSREMARSNGTFAPRKHKAERARAYAIVLAVIGNSTLPKSDKARLINRIRIALVDDRRPSQSIFHEARLVLDRVWRQPDSNGATRCLFRQKGNSHEKLPFPPKFPRKLLHPGARLRYHQPAAISETAAVAAHPHRIADTLPSTQVQDVCHRGDRETESRRPVAATLVTANKEAPP